MGQPLDMNIFLSGIHRRCHIRNLVGGVVLEMFNGKYVIDPPTRDTLGSKTWYEQILSGTHRRCDVLSLVKIGLVVLEKILKVFFCLFIIIFPFFVILQLL